jgi:transposase
MTRQRRTFSAQEKAAIVRRHLMGKEPITKIAEELSIQPAQIKQWLAQAIEQIEVTFERTTKSARASKMAEGKVNQIKEHQIKRLQDKLIQKNEVIAELMEENVRAKKANGEL